MVLKCKVSRLNLLKMLSRKTKKSDKQCLLCTYKTYIRSILDYGCTVGANTTLSVQH